MPVETGVTGIQDLNENWPLPTDLLPEANEHLQNIKLGLHGSFAHMAANGGVVTVTATELNALAGTTANVQTQIDAKPDSIIWTKPASSSSVGGVTDYVLQPNTRVLIQREVGDTNLRCTLPLVAESSDGDIIEIRPIDLTLAPNAFEVTTQLLETMYALNGDSTWVDAQSVVVDPTDHWPYVQCTFQVALSSRWVVRVVEGVAQAL